VHILCPHIPSPHRSVNRPKKAKIKDKITQKSEIPGKVCIQNISQKSPKKQKSKATIHQKKKQGNLPKEDQSKGLKKRK
jgi:hypothetical protein